jgi:hypothetical protein
MCQVLTKKTPDPRSSTKRESRVVGSDAERTNYQNPVSIHGYQSWQATVAAASGEEEITQADTSK